MDDPLSQYPNTKKIWCTVIAIASNATTFLDQIDVTDAEAGTNTDN